MDNIENSKNIFIETKQLLLDLKRCGQFYHRAIEIDLMAKPRIDGEQFEKRINELLNKLKNK